jgi:hypothetical protein
MKKLTYRSSRWRRFEPEGLIVGGLNVLKMIGVGLIVVPVLLYPLLEYTDGVPTIQSSGDCGAL